jgi:Flp pilus assembly protein TadD
LLRPGDFVKLSRCVGLVAGAVSLLALMSGPALAEKWNKAETGHFVVYGNGDSGALRKAAENLEAFDDLFWTLYGLESPAEAGAKLKVYLVSGGIADLRRVSPDISAGTGGFYSASPEETFAIALRADDQSITQHEYVHYLMLRHFPSAYPAWFVEGYAEYLMTADIKERSADVGKPNEGRQYSLTNDKWLPWTDVLEGRVYDIPTAKRATFYAQAWLLTHYFYADPARTPQLEAYIAALAKGEKSVDAMTKATGMNPQALEKAMRFYYASASHYREIDRSKRAKPEVAVTALPPSAELMLEDLDVRTGVPDSAKADVLATIRAKAPRYADDAFAELALARAEIVLGDPTVGAAMLKKRLAANPNDVDALTLEAQRLMKAGDADTAKRQALYDEAGAMLVRAFQLDPTRYQTLFAFTRTRVLDPHYPSDNALQALLISFKLAPQVADMRLETARALIIRGKKTEAAALLTILANNPHGGPAATAAKAMLDGIAAPS